MIKKRLIAVIIVSILGSFITASTVQSHHLSYHYTGHWRLPFSDSRAITNAVNEGFHTGASLEAIDYAGSFPVYAPADGTIFGVQNVVDFGWVVRIRHVDVLGFEVFSFFAHMDQNSIQGLTVGNSIRQGDFVGTSSNTGTGGGSGAHLHFEARTNANANNVYSGNSVPITGIPGQWWYKWYSPPPNFQHNVAKPSGAARYPVSWNLPTGIDVSGFPVRHLSNWTAPTHPPAVFFSNVSSTAATIQWGGRPTTINNNQLSGTFQTKEYVTGIGWQTPNGGYTTNSGLVHSLVHSGSNQNVCTPTKQHCHAVWVWNNQNGWSVRQVFYFHAGDSNNPYLSVSHKSGSANPDLAVLTYDFAGASRFVVYEDTPGGNPPSIVYDGTAKTALVRHQSNRSYSVVAYVPSQGWMSSHWVVP